MTRCLFAVLLVVATIGPASGQNFLFPEPPSAGLNDTYRYCMNTNVAPKAVINACETVLKPATLIMGDKWAQYAQPAAILSHIGVAALKLGDSNAATKYFDAAIQFTDEVLKLFPNDVWANAQMCSLTAIRQTDMDSGFADCDRALAAKPTDAQFLDTKGFMLYRQRKYADALIAYNSAIQQAPTRASALFMRGVVKKALGDKTSQDDIDAATASDPKIGAAYSYIGVTTE